MNISKTTVYIAVLALIALFSAGLVTAAYAEGPSATPLSSVETSGPAAVSLSSVESSGPASVSLSTVETSGPVAVPLNTIEASGPASVSLNSVENSGPVSTPLNQVNSGTTNTTPPANTSNTSGGQISAAPVIVVGSGRGGVVTVAQAILGSAQCGNYIQGAIRIGSAANNVLDIKKLQSFLIVNEGAAIEVTGIYDAKTIAAVRAFQTKYASEVLAPWSISYPTGEIIITTNGKINALICKRIYELSQNDKNAIALVNGQFRTGSTVIAKNTKTTNVKNTPVPTVTLTANATSTVKTASKPSVGSNVASAIMAVPKAIGNFVKWLFHW